MSKRRNKHLRKMARDMQPNRILARLFSGGRHQTWKAIITAPFKEHTVHTPKSGRAAYEKRIRKAKAEAAAKQRREQPKKPKRPKPAAVPITVNPRTGKVITYEQAVRALHEAEDRANRLAAGLPGDKPRRNPRGTLRT
jgi:hypothetical protein